MRPRLDHLLARAPIHRAPQRLQVGLLRTPLGEVGQPPLGEAVRGVDHGPVAVAAGASLAHHARPVLGIDAAIAAHADLGEPDPADRARLAVAQLDGHADAAHVPVAVVRERALAGEEALHRRQGDAADVSWSGPLEEPEGHASSWPLAYHGSAPARRRRVPPLSLDELLPPARRASIRPFKSVR